MMLFAGLFSSWRALRPLEGLLARAAGAAANGRTQIDTRLPSSASFQFCMPRRLPAHLAILARAWPAGRCRTLIDCIALHDPAD